LQQAGERDLLTDASWKLMPGQRAGLVGANGAGKSTLLKAIAGLRGVDSGKLLIANSVSLGYLAQTAVSGSTRTVYDEVRNAMQQLVAAEAAMVAAAAAFEAGDPTAPDRLADAQADFEAAGGYDADRRIGTVLDGLGFSREQWDWGCDRFSGGWQMRIALACMLLSPAGQAATGKGSSGSAGVGGGLLLLDEPTNHLDAKAVAWLAQFLAASAATLVLVSHDEGLLEGACDRIVEVRRSSTCCDALCLWVGWFRLLCCIMLDHCRRCRLPGSM
jgi:ATPase subunit of ABC transporter with duplicated ATPase domains